MKKFFKRLKRVLLFLFNSFNEIKKLLNEEGIVNIMMYRTMDWRHDGVFYFLGEYQGKRVFIKYMDDDTVPQNEWNAYNQLKQREKFQEKYFIECFFYRKFNNAGIVVSEYVKGKTLKEMKFLTKKTKEYVVRELNKVLDILSDAKIVHRDINPSNIYFENGNVRKLKIIDFAYSTSTDENSKLKETIKSTGKLKGLNEDYIEKPFIWDDAFAMKKIVEEKLKLESNKISEKVGKLVYTARKNQNSFQEDY